MRILKLTDKNTLTQAMDELRRGRVLVCPTDTVYGLVARIKDSSAMERIFQIKGREKGKPFPVFIKDMDMAKELAEVSSFQEEFLNSVWPGKVTAILKSRGKVSGELESHGTIGLRIPAYEFLNRLLDGIKEPLSGTSANIAGQPSLSDSREVVTQFKGRKHQPDMLIDAGQLSSSLSSTIVDLTKEPMQIIRQGAVAIL